jgi:hypothetical protein
MTSSEIGREHSLSIKRVRRERDKIQTTQEMTRQEYKRRYLTVVVSEGPRHILRRPR